ncbi:MAG: type II toxin-antitoxin system prevent-host-death family antitoxin [Acidobacteriota bacterium]|nr:type II toxin-antitoxin system prevent-host-death family antitoxin [Acidobacteriota bacterium]
MTKTVSINEAQSQLQGLLALTRNGDEIIIEENGEPLARLVPIEKFEPKQRVLGLGRGKGYFMSEDFDDELPDEFWGFDKEL